MNHASMRLDVLFFIVYDIDEELPWHSTLSRTRGLYGEEVFKELFKQVLSLCVHKGMVGGKRQAIDNAYIKANASLDSLIEKEVLEDGNRFADELKLNDETKVKAEKKKEVERHHQWKEEEYKNQPGHNVKKAGKLDEFGNTIRPKFLSNHTHYSKTDGDARISVKPGKPRQMNYSAQTCVDTRGHVITNIMADYSDKRDSQSLAQAIAQTKENLKANNLQLEEVLADSGYSSGSALRYLKENNLIGYIPNFGQYKPIREGFIYNKEKDQYECMKEGGSQAVLPYKRTGSNSNGYIQKTYRSSETVCKSCPLKSQCIGKSNFKKLDESIDKPLYDEMHERLKTKKAKRLKKQRSSTVEPVLGTLINFMGMRRVWTRGIKNANKFMIGAATAYNLKKWLKYKERKMNAQMIVLPKPLKSSCFNVFGIILRHKLKFIENFNMNLR